MKPALNRCFLPPESWGKNVSLTGREAHHLITVLRVRAGDRILCLDGQGRQAEATVRCATGRSVTLELGTPQRLPDPAVKITLGVAVPGHGKLETVVNEATQLGVVRIIPLLTERCVVRLSEDRSRRKQEHLLQVATEALKQSGNGWLPRIDPFTSWKAAVGLFPEFGRILLATIEGPHMPWRTLLGSDPSSRGQTPLDLTILLLIGPEGDLSPEEVRQAVEAGAHRVSLGPWVLRTETACAAALAILQVLLRESDPRVREDDAP